ncbi:testin [Sitodiplosis mosellana]|uniref:testin n=1 Tax=Sitodiplosis mosellana TaxID=263140 RepID=UPI002444BE61|nr:testin [Sitodiplosis mosellana]
MNKVQPELDAAPTLGWLAELESRKDNVRGKLAHEFGAGAACNNCDRCTGLDLHFWRKACRICKCRGDQHDCKDDDLAGFMQFEILGQKRSTPAYVSIKTVPEPTRVDWVPPNVDPKLAAEYMNELETDNIPITGSKAALKRKERLNYQVPIHDLDASLCHNLSEKEASQLSQYVGQIKEHNVGQGMVVRVEDIKVPQIEFLQSSHDNKNENYASSYMGRVPVEAKPIPDAIKRDKILSFIMNSKAIQNIIHQPNSAQPNSKLTLSNRPLDCDFNGNVYLSTGDKRMLENIGIDQQALQSSIINGRIYDKLFAKLDACKINYGQCCLLQPLKDLRATVIDGNDRNFNNNIGNLVTALEMENPIEIACPAVYNSMDQSRCAQSTDPDDISSLLNDLQIENQPIYENLKRQPIYENLPISNYMGNVSTTARSNLNEPKAAMMCKTCEQPILTGTIAVKAHRAGDEVAWHPKCFTCHKCGDLLADLVYFYHQGNIYCGRDLAEVLNFERCGACDEIIWSKEYTSAEGSSFHIKHFCCYHCDTPLAGKQYTPDDQTKLPLCLDCYGRYYAENCQNCRRNISPEEEAVSFQQSHWHKSCFNCAGAKCGKSLIGGRFCIKFDLPFCSAACIQDSCR